jgi:hypothetical protein
MKRPRKSAAKSRGKPAAHFTASPGWNGEPEGVSIWEFGLLCYLQVQELQGKPAPNRAELAARIPGSERTLDGGLAELKRRGLIEQHKDRDPLAGVAAAGEIVRRKEDAPNDFPG